MLDDLFNNMKERRVRIAVVGDIAIDQYHYGAVSRISPEFPVPILRSHGEIPEFCPGCASNVCFQLSNFNCSAYLFGFVDAHYRRRLPNLKFDTDGCVDLPINGMVPRKIRFYDNEFPLLRWDIEPDNYGLSDLNELRSELLQSFMRRLDSGLDAVILSNYDKGVFNSDLAQCIINECKSRGVMTIVDPKSDYNKWVGCDVFKPNASEAFRLTQCKDWREQATQIQQKIGCSSVIITQAGDGVVGKNCGTFFEYKRRHTIKEVTNSVIGAGDCFAAVLAILLANDTKTEDAAAYAFEAGTEYVKAKHNRPLYPHELHKRLDQTGAKIVKGHELALLMKTCYAGKKIIATNGCFDVLHLKHLELLEYAKTLGDKLIVAVNTNASVSRLKGKDRPINSLPERMKILASLGCVDFVVAFDEDTPYELYKDLKISAICKGGDYDKSQVIGVDLVGSDNVHLFPYTQGYSTSNIIQKIKNQL